MANQLGYRIRADPVLPFLNPRVIFILVLWQINLATGLGLVPFFRPPVFFLVSRVLPFFALFWINNPVSRIRGDPVLLLLPLLQNV